MGKLVPLHPKYIAPSQPHLTQGTIAYILEFFRTAETTLPPPPLVKQIDGRYVAIDGHNLLAVCQHMDIECDVYLVDHPQDHLPGNDPMTHKRNEELSEKFHCTPMESFSDLVNRHEHFF